ncbi:MAG TPA: hypothetical protein VMF89_00515, partial [Polyangiales bacterium]|nr:hypothetical protein [Polyangiales bacterium]
MHHGKRSFDGWLSSACFVACAALPTLTHADEPLAVHTVQGAAHLSPYQGQVVSVGPAIVTAVRSNGFYMQDETPDDDAATSEGIFVFTDTAPAVTAGARVTVQGTVAEFRPGCTPSCGATSSAFDNLTTTEITAPTVTVVDTDNPLPTAVVLGSEPGQRSAPLQVICDDGTEGGVFDPESDGIDFYESLEGMRVQIDRAEVIDPTRTFDGATPSLEIGVLARADAGLRTARGGIFIAQGDFNPERVFLANALVSSFPSVNVGDRFDGAIVGVLDYTFANYKLVVTEALPAVIAGNLAQETTTLAATLPQQLSIASKNVENLDAADDPAKISELAKNVVESLQSP